MIVKCISKFPSEDQLKSLGSAFFKDRAFHVTVGKEYVVLGLSVAWEPNSMGCGPSIQIVTDYGHLSDNPLCLFRIIDGKVSRHWELRMREDGLVSLWPPSFFKEYYHDDLSEGVPEVVEDFKRVRAAIEAEAIGREQAHSAK